MSEVKYTVVPLKPTRAMIAAAAKAAPLARTITITDYEWFEEVYLAMLRAAPQDNVSAEGTEYCTEFRVLHPPHPDYEAPQPSLKSAIDPDFVPPQ